ncbi:MAG: UDP-N-acetylmuramate dehydrogenase [Alphaproteobacteria bacterium]|nr:UDP-N-acetylmuramate dehydrogenase [Alphaproteobacteria bacterium]
MLKKDTFKIPKLKAKICKNYDLAKKTWLGVGGPAQYYIEPQDLNDLELIFKNKADMPITILGAGSNILIRDGGIDGIVIHLGKSFKNYEVEKNCITCAAGLSLIELAKIAAQNGLSGFEFMSGIPGSLGGGLKMNAGAYGSDMSQIVTELKVMDLDGKLHKIIPSKTNFFAYRHSEIPEGWIFVEAILQGIPKDKKIILETMENLRQKRIQTQPQKVRTAGSTFKNPPNIPAWKLIDAAGLRGYTYKGAKMSEKHSNFMINEGHASATTLEELGEFVRTTVADKTGQTLEWEIKRIGKRK